MLDVKLEDISGRKRKVYLKAKIEVLETDSQIKYIRDLYRDINNFKKGYQPGTNRVKDQKGDLVADSQSIWLGGGNMPPSH